LKKDKDQLLSRNEDLNKQIYNLGSQISSIHHDEKLKETSFIDHCHKLQYNLHELNNKLVELEKRNEYLKHDIQDNSKNYTLNIEESNHQRHQFKSDIIELHDKIKSVKEEYKYNEDKYKTSNDLYQELLKNNNIILRDFAQYKDQISKAIDDLNHAIEHSRSHVN